MNEFFVYLFRYGVQKVKKEKNMINVSNSVIENLLEVSNIAQTIPMNDQPISMVTKKGAISSEHPIVNVEKQRISQATRGERMVYLAQQGHPIDYHNPISYRRDEL